MVFKSIARKLAHTAFRSGKAKKYFLSKYCSAIHKSKVLELGSGKKVDGKYIYSVRDYFEKHTQGNKFIMTDIVPEFGHRHFDITNTSARNAYDVILCLNVLEHVYDFHKAAKNLHAALKKGGTLLVLVPAFYPLHDEPHDYWRFTEHSLRKLFSHFRKVEVEPFGIRQFPSYYFAKCIK